MKQKELFLAIGGISDQLIMEADGSEKKVRHTRVLRIAALTVVILTLLELTALAASMIISSRVIDSGNIPDYYSVPTRETLQRDIGIQFNVMDTFSNGYFFKSGQITQIQDNDEAGKVFEQYKGLQCEYKRGDNTFYLHVTASITGNQMEHIEITERYKDCEIQYYAYTNKIVPGNYEFTEQDKQDKESGKYVFTYGGDTIEIQEVQGVGFEYGGLSYHLNAIGNNITKDELIQMAKEIIDYQE